MIKEYHHSIKKPENIRDFTSY